MKHVTDLQGVYMKDSLYKSYIEKGPSSSTYSVWFMGTFPPPKFDPTKLHTLIHII